MIVTNYSHQLILYIDDLRKSQHISKDEFIKDIMSLRQYNRLLKNESTITSEKLIDIADNLGLDMANLHNNFLKSYDEETRITRKIYSDFNQGNFSSFEVLVSSCNIETFRKQNKDLINVLQTICHTLQKKIPKNVSIDRISNIIRYPKVLDNSFITLYELMGLFHLADSSENINTQKKIGNTLVSLIKENRLFVTPAYENSLMSVYANIARLFVKLEQYENVISICKYGINMAKNNNIDGLSHFYFYIIIAFIKTDKRDRSEIYQQELAYLLKLKNNNKVDESIKTSLNVNFDIDVNKFYL